MFSNEEIARRLDRDFVCVWRNKDAGVTFPDGLYDDVTAEEYRKFPIGTGQTNIVSTFARPDGRVLNAVPGYLDPERFLREMELALMLRDEGPATIAQAHAQQALLEDGTVAAEAHRRLERAGILRMPDMNPDYFDD